MIFQRRTLVKLYAAAVIVLGIAGLTASAALDPGPSDVRTISTVGLLTFAILGLILQVTEYRLAFGSGHSSISFIVYMGAALVFGPTLAAAIAGSSYLVSQLVHRRTMFRTAFNVSQAVLSVIAGSSAYILLGGAVPPTSIDHAILPFCGFIIGFFGVNTALVSGVISLNEGRSFSEVWLRNTGSTVAYDIFASALGLGIAWLYVDLGLKGIALIVVPILFLRHTYLMNQQLQDTNRELLELMVKAIEARDPYTSGHSQRVSEIARQIAKDLGLTFKDVDLIEHAALLHDVGKIYEEYAPLLRKDGKLTEDERALMKTHAARSAELVSTISALRGPVERFVRHHHENFDGSGYPDGLMGDDIPLGARIIMIADTADAMTTDRPYRKALPFERVVGELDRLSSRQFDPMLVSVFKRSASIRQLVQSRAPIPELVRSRDREMPARVAVR